MQMYKDIRSVVAVNRLKTDLRNTIQRYTGEFSRPVSDFCEQLFSLFAKPVQSHRPPGGENDALTNQLCKSTFLALRVLCRVTRLKLKHLFFFVRNFFMIFSDIVFILFAPYFKNKKKSKAL